MKGEVTPNGNFAGEKSGVALGLHRSHKIDGFENIVATYDIEDTPI